MQKKSAKSRVILLPAGPGRGQIHRSWRSVESTDLAPGPVRARGKRGLRL